jgi:RHS repeat-associated protein
LESGQRAFVRNAQSRQRGDVTLIVPTPNAIVPAVSVNTASTAVTLPAALTLTGSASEAANPNAVFTYSWSSVYGPGTATFNPPDAVTTQAVFSAPGKYVLRFSANDGTNSNSADVVVTAISSYSPPTLSAGFDAAVTLPNTLQLVGYLTGYGSLPLQSLTWSSVAGPGTVTFSNPTTTGSIIASTSATFSAPGQYILRLSAVDAGAGASSDVTITVKPIPTPPPVPDAGFDRTVFVGQLFQINGVAPAGTSSFWSGLTYNGTPNFPTVTAFGTPGGQPGQVSLILSAEGTYIFRFTVRDNSTGLQSFKDVTINCLPDAAPIVNAGATVYATLQPPTPLHGTVTFSNPTLGDPQITWSKVYGPDVTFSNPHTADTVATFSGIGHCHLVLSATDGVYSASSEVDVYISATNNRPPVVNAGPPQTITLPQSAALAGSATDDGLPQRTLAIFWHKISGPASVAFADAASPVTTASFSAPGTYILRLSADDANLVSNSDTTVTVLAQNQAPVVSAGPNQVVAANAPLTLNGSTSDDGLPNPPGTLTFNWSKLSGPGNAAFTTPGSAVTSVTFDTPGSYTLQLSASDSLLTSSATVTIIVTPPLVNKPPVVSAGPNQTLRLPQGTTALSGSASDDGLPNPPGALTIAWTKVSGPGTVTFGNSTAANTTATFTTAGKYILSLTATDGALSTTAKVSITVLAPITAAPPNVSIDSPVDGIEITKPTDLLATITCATAVTWVLEYALNTDEDNAANLTFVPFATGSGTVANAKIAAFDPTLLLNGTYQVRLTATDSSGQAAATAISLVARKNMKVGNFAIAFNDLTVPVAGVPIQIVRSYDSRDTRTGDFGAGWQLAVRDVRLEKTVNLGKQWFQTADFTSFLGSFAMQEGRPHKVTITFPDGKVYEFQGALSPSQQQAGTITAGTYGFTPIAPTLGTLAVVGDNDILVNGAPDEQNTSVPVTLNNLNGTLFNPTLFKLTTVEGAEFVIDQKKGLVSMTDLNGNSVTFTDNGIISSTGKSIVFDRDAQGRIAKITDPAGQSMTYAYDASGNLISFTDRVGNSTGFTFDNTHKLISIIDPRGITPIQNAYGPDGRLLSHTDAFGKQITYTHDIPGRTETVTDRLGNTTVHTYDDDGNVLSTTDAEGGFTQMSYDTRDNVLSMTDALNRVTHYEYDAIDNKTAEVNNLGERSEYTFDPNRRMLTMKDPLGRVTTNTYDFKENLLQTSDPLGFVTKYEYNYQARHGQPVKMTDAQNNVWQYFYDNDGNRLTSIDPQANVSTIVYGNNNVMLSQSVTRTKPGGGTETLTTIHEYDAQNRPTKSILPDGTFTSMTYNSIGKQATMTDQLGRVTRHDYNELGYHVKTTYPDGLFDASTYDAEGRRQTSIDRAGRTMTYVYDKVGRTTQVTYPDTTSSSTTYDLSGQVTQSTDARGNVTKYEYDNVGRRSKVTDAINKITQFTYDTNGNQKTIVDALNHTMTYDYDLDNRRTKTTFHDGTFTSTEYDNLSRRTAEVDQAGKRTQYGYDTLGRLAQVTDAIGKVTRYAYNEIGQQIGQIDALNRVTSYEYDQLGRRVKRTLPQGQIENYVYNNVGSLTNRVDFNGKTTTYLYDTLNRLTQKIPDASFNAPTVTYTYTPTGHRASMTDASGATAYTYNSRDWLTSKATPEGTLNYTYDVAGNLATLRTNHTNGASMDYAYDTLNRLSTAHDNTINGSTTYAYDDVGNLQSFAYPNGTSHTYTYDNLNRLTNLTGKAANTTIAQYAYTLGASGNRIGVAELSGRHATYGYDDLYRLVGETISGVAQSGTISYIYDAVGNRMVRNSTVPTVAAVTQSFSSNDWLTSDTYDNNGNTQQSAAVTYTYDYENRIAGTSSGIQITYDGDGNRVSKTVNGITTQYLVDTNNLTGYAQVVEELNAVGALKTVYSFGHELISKIDPVNGIAFYGFDGHGSVRYLTGQAGQITDTYDYDAFGILIGRTGTTANNFLYCGEQFDPDLGFYYLRARYMNPNSGRFMSMDDYEGNNRNAESLHKYLYVQNEPIGNVDSSGRFATLSELMTASAMIIKNYSLRIGPAIAAGGATIGRLWNALGDYAESLAMDVMSLFRSGVIVRGIEMGKSVIDFSFRIGTRIANIEVKWSLPSSEGGSLTRLVNQANNMVAYGASNAQAVIWSVREPTARAIDTVSQALGANMDKIQFVNGVEGLYKWIEFYFKVNGPG